MANPQIIKISSKVFLLLYLFIFGCGTPDLNDAQTLFLAKREAIDIENLERKLMGGIINLYVDDQDQPYSGWVKELFPNKEIKRLGYLKKGQKEGTWLSWFPSGDIESKVDWNKDIFFGRFDFWHQNGVRKVSGQTRDGEVDGEWKNFYSCGLLASRVVSKVGIAISAEVWTPDGRKCKRTNLENGNGWYCEYDENMSLKKVAYFTNGVGKDLEPESW